MKRTVKMRQKKLIVALRFGASLRIFLAVCPIAKLEAFQAYPSRSKKSSARHFRAVTYPLTQKLAYLCESMHYLKNDQSRKFHEETTSFRAASSSSGSENRSDRGLVSSISSRDFRDLSTHFNFGLN